MKKIGTIFLILFAIHNMQAQESIDDLLAAGIADTKQFATDYITPANDGLAYGINTGWLTNAKALKKYGFRLSIIGNGSFIKDENKSFIMDVNDYQNIRFTDGSQTKNVATALGNNDPDITVLITYDDPIFGGQEVELTLPTGIGATDVNLIPTFFLQGSFSPFKGTEVKARYFPKMDIEDVEVGLYGVGIQQEFTAWLSEDKIFPLAISGLVAYTKLDGSYNFTETNIVEGENQVVETETSTMLYQLAVGTKLKVINFYGALGYIDGESTTDLKGTYRVSNGVITTSDIVDPFSIERETSGVTTTLGANLKLGFFGLDASYTLAEFDSASLGIHFMF